MNTDRQWQQEFEEQEIAAEIEREFQIAEQENRNE